MAASADRRAVPSRGLRVAHRLARPAPPAPCCPQPPAADGRCEDHRHEERRPRQVQQRPRRRRGQKPAHRLQVLQRLARVAAPRRIPPGAVGGVEHPLVQRILEPRTDPRQDASSAQAVRHQPVEIDHDGEQHDQRRLRAAGQHPVVDLQHEQRPGEHQQVHRRTQRADDDQRTAMPGQNRTRMQITAGGGFIKQGCDGAQSERAPTPPGMPGGASRQPLPVDREAPAARARAVPSSPERASRPVRPRRQNRKFRSPRSVPNDRNSPPLPKKSRPCW